MQLLGRRDWHLYATHSFRRGGAQYRLSQGWPIGKVAIWGGWSQLEAITMFRYFYSPTDHDGHMHFFDRNVPIQRTPREMAFAQIQWAQQQLQMYAMPFIGF